MKKIMPFLLELAAKIIIMLVSYFIVQFIFFIFKLGDLSDNTVVFFIFMLAALFLTDFIYRFIYKLIKNNKNKDENK